MSSRRAVAAAVVAGVLVTASACGQTPQQAYCSQLQHDAAHFGAIVNGSDPGAALLQAVPMLQGLSDAAPADLNAQWQVFVNAVAGLRQALATAKVRPDEFHGNHVPARIQGQQRSDIVAAANVLTSPQVVAAVQAIDEQARDVCKIDLGI